MFTLKCLMHDHFYEVDSDSLDEILSFAIAAFDQHAGLISISEDGVVKYEYKEIYDLIKKACY